MGKTECMWDKDGAWCSTNSGKREGCTPRCPIPPLDDNNHIPRGKSGNIKLIPDFEIIYIYKILNNPFLFPLLTTHLDWVNCGEHAAATCSECATQPYCNGECEWHNETPICRLKGCNPLNFTLLFSVSLNINKI